jgi:hypothetical protein
LLEAVPDKAAEQHTGASAKEDAGSPDAPAAANANEPPAEPKVNGSGAGPDSGTSAAEQNGRLAVTLLEKLREAGEETV